MEVILVGHYVYKYVLDNEIVYIGKNDTDLHSRIYQHTLEEKFQPVKNAQIYFIELENSVESRIMEELLINKYKPALNVVSKQSGISISFEEPSWKKYTPPEKSKKNRQYTKIIEKGIDAAWSRLSRNKQEFLKRCFACNELSFKTISELAEIDNDLYDIECFVQAVYDCSIEDDYDGHTRMFHWIEEIFVYPTREFVEITLNSTARMFLKDVN